MAASPPPAHADYDAGKRALEAGKPVQAATQWREAAQGGDGRAMLALGRLLVQGLGVVQDYVEAHKWLDLAAHMGGAEAAKERDALAARMTPQQLAQAQEQAIAELSAAAERGVPRAMLALGRMLVYGVGVLQDYAQGYKWLFLAASVGVEEAARERDALAAKMTQDRVAEAREETVAELRAAAERGDRQAMLMLGRLHARGQGVVQNYREAHKWLNLAASRGEASAMKERDAVAARMTPGQVAKAQEQASLWRPRRAEPVRRAPSTGEAAGASNAPARAQVREEKPAAAKPRRQRVAAMDAKPSGAAAQAIDKDGCYQTAPDCFSSRGEWEYISGVQWGYDMYYANNCRNRVFAKLCFNGVYLRNKCFEHGFMAGERRHVHVSKDHEPKGQHESRWVGSTRPDNDSLCAAKWIGRSGVSWNDPPNFR